MSKFFTYDDRLEIQKGLKENESFKSIAKRLGKSPSTISREVRNYLSEVATGHPGFPFNACKNRFDCRVKKYVEEIVPEHLPSTVNCAETATCTVLISLKKSVRQDFVYHMYVMAVRR